VVNGNHCALIAGGSCGIGRAIANTLNNEGHRVLIISRRHPTTWEDGPLPDWSIEQNWIQADLSHISVLESTLQKLVVLPSFSPNILVYSAVSYGIGQRHLLIETTSDEWATVFQVNVHAAQILTRLLLPSLSANAPSLILHISSEVAYNPGPQRVAYSASKTANRAMFAGLAKEVAHQPIHIVGMLPAGMVDTPGIRRRRSPDFDFSGYAAPSSFAHATHAVLASLGQDFHNQMLIIEADGSYEKMQDNRIVSQS